jgi:hypothetical protein
VAGRYAYVVGNSGYLQVIDVSTPSAPVRVSAVSAGSILYSVAVSGRYAYVVNSGALQVIDVSTPLVPVNVGSVGTGSVPHSVAVSGRYAYVANNFGNTLQVFDVSVPSAPVSIGSVGTGNAPESVAVSGRYAYVANSGSNTLQVFDMGGAYVQHLEAGAVEVGTLQTRDTITAGNNLDVRGGLTVSASARISGSLGADNISATSFSGNGNGLTGLSAVQLSGTIAQASLGATSSYTPTLSSSSGNFSASTQSGYYAKVGNLIYFEAWIVWQSTNGASGNISVTLPLPVVSTRAVFHIGYVNGITGVNQLVAIATSGNSSASIDNFSGSTGNTTGVPVSDCKNTGEIQITGTYRWQ